MRLGDAIRVKVISIDENNKVRVSKKAMEERPTHNESFNDRSRDSRPNSYRDRNDKKRN
jgi:predicted RNA-binding protein with RPS1 domain